MFLSLPESIVVSEPAEEPVTRQEAKDRLNITDALDDSDIDMFIQSGREEAESYMERSIITQDRAMEFNHFPRDLEILMGPVQSVVSITYLDADGNLQTLSTSNYTLVDGKKKRSWILRASDVDWPDTYDSANAVTVTTRNGWGNAASVPASIKNAILIAVGHWVRHQASAEGGVPFRMPRQFYDLLDKYKVKRF